METLLITAKDAESRNRRGSMEKPVGLFVNKDKKRSASLLCRGIYLADQ